MRAAIFHSCEDVRIEAVPDPAPAAGELLLEVRAAGICGTDAHEYAHGPAMFPIHRRHPVTGHVGPMIPGHELAGRVVATGEDVKGFRQGELVVSGAGISCGRCAWCRRGRTNLCARYASVGLQRHGGLAQYCAVPAAICRSVEPHGLTDDAAALTQPMSIAVHAMRRGRLGSQDDAMIIGAGGVGAFLTFAAASTGARVTVLDLDPERLAIAERLGAGELLRPASDAPVSEQLPLAEGCPTVVFEVSGTPAGLRTAIQVLPSGGRSPCASSSWSARTPMSAARISPRPCGSWPRGTSPGATSLRSRCRLTGSCRMASCRWPAATAAGSRPSSTHGRTYRATRGCEAFA